MVMKMTRAEIDAHKGKPTPPASTAPVEPAPSLAALTQAMTTMSEAVIESARMAAQAQADIALIAARTHPNLEANIVRDTEGRMSRVIITSRNRE